MKRFEIYDELQKLKCPFQTKISSIIQLPGLRATIYAVDRPSAIQVKEILMKSTVIEEIKRYGEDETKIVLSRVPPQFLNNDILKVIDTYAKLIRINNILDQYGIQIGSKHVFVKKEDMRHIPRFLLMGAVQVHVRYEEQPAFCEYCKESGHERHKCKHLDDVRKQWQRKETKQNFEGPTSNENDRPTPHQPPPNTDIVFDSEYPQLAKQNKRAQEEVSPTVYITKCCQIKLNAKRKSDLCSCAKKFYKCKCGYWYPETDYINGFRCELCDRVHFKCPPTCGHPQYLIKGEITSCNKRGTVYDDTGARLSTETI